MSFNKLLKKIDNIIESKKISEKDIDTLIVKLLKKKEKESQNITIIPCYNIKNHENIKYFKNEKIIKWLNGDLEFLNYKEKNVKNTTSILKKREDDWGKEIYKDMFNKEISQWSGPFGEKLVEEVLNVHGYNIINKQVKIDNYIMDFELDEYYLEVKTQTYYTIGSAGEKIFGVPFKYANIPSKTGKKLVIICIGNAEKLCKEKYFCLGENIPEKQKKMIDMYNKEGIYFIGFSSMYYNLISHLL